MTVCYSVCVHLCLIGNLPKRKRKAKTEKDDTGDCYEGGYLGDYFLQPFIYFVHVLIKTLPCPRGDCTLVTPWNCTCNGELNVVHTDIDL